MSMVAADAKRELLESFLWPGEDASEETRRKYQGSSQLRSLLNDVVQIAAEHVARQNAPDDLNVYANEGAQIVFGLRDSVTEWNASTENDLNFWRHDDNPLHRVKQDGQPYMQRETIQSFAEHYLRLPYRVPRVERVLVDMLVALELYSFADEMIRKPFARWLLPVASPLQQRHMFIRYVTGIFWNVALFGGIAYAAQMYLSHSVAEWVTPISLGLLVLSVLVATVALPIAWRGQRKARKHVRNLIQLLDDTYRELGPSGAVSTRRVRELASKAADAGVAWPGSLFAVLDDNIGRVGRL